MNVRVVLWAYMIVGLLALRGAAADQAAPASTRPATVPAKAAAIISIEGAIDDMTARSMFRRFEQARKDGATTIILRLKTYGGALGAALEMSRFLRMQTDLHTIAFVDGQALSAGSMLALACNEIWMAPHSQIGDCTPILISPQGGLQPLSEAERAKVEGPVLTDFRDSARLNGHNEPLVLAMVSVGLEVRYLEKDGQRRFANRQEYETLAWEGWKPVADVPNPLDADNTLLALHTELAVKVGLARGVTSSATALAKQLGLTVIAEYQPTSAVADDAAPASTRPATAPSKVTAIISIEGAIDDMTARSMFRRFEQARKDGATTVILRLKTPGGALGAALDMSRFLRMQTDLHTIAFVDGQALSAGSMLALACNEIWMAPHSQIGDCAPILVSPQGGLQPLPEAERAKFEGPVLTDFRDSARLNGHNETLVLAMVSVGLEVRYIEKDGQRRFANRQEYETLVWEGWKPVPDVPSPLDADNTLLTLHTELAVKVGLARGVAKSAAELAAQLGLTVVNEYQPTSGENIVGALTSMGIRGILMLVFLMSLYAAFNTPGHGLPEVAAVIALSLMVVPSMMSGDATMFEIIAVLVGIALLAVEIFLLPGFGIAGITGLVLIVGGLVATMVPNEPAEFPGFFPSLPGTRDAMWNALMMVLAGMIVSLALWFWLVKYLPRLPYFGRAILAPNSGVTVAPQPVDTSTAAVAEHPQWPILGQPGKTVTDLMPGGSAEFVDERLGDTRVVDVISDSGYIARGTAVVIVDFHTNRPVVRAERPSS